MDEKFIAYKGKKFTIEWYYNAKKESEALEYFEDLTLDRKKKLAQLLKVMGEMGQIRNDRTYASAMSIS